MSSIASTLARERTTAAPLALVAVIAAAAMLALPALWNRYPLTYYDSVDYVLMPFTWDMPIYRTGAYGVFAGLARVGGGLWAIVVAQCVMVAYVLYESLRLFAPAAPRRALIALTATLCVLTGLPWFTSQIMPDAFTGAVVLAIITLAFADQWLDRWREAALGAILAVGIAVHTSHFALAGGLILCLFAARALAVRGWPLLRPRLCTALIAFVAALGMAIGANWLIAGRPFLAQPSAVLTLGLFVQDGLAKRYLDEVCKRPGPDKPGLCMARNRLPVRANDFLWNDDDFWKLGGWVGMQAEADRIVKGCITQYPFTYALTSLELMLQQLAMVDTGDGLTPMQYFIGHAIQRYYPHEMRTFVDARQQQGIELALVNEIQVPILLFSGAALIPILWLAWRRRDRVSVTLASLVLLALLGNAFVCGALSNPNDRYQSRIAWVPVLVLALTGARLLGLTRGEVRRPLPWSTLDG